MNLNKNYELCIFFINKLTSVIVTLEVPSSPIILATTSKIVDASNLNTVVCEKFICAPAPTDKVKDKSFKASPSLFCK